MGMAEQLAMNKFEKRRRTNDSDSNSNNNSENDQATKLRMQ